MAEPQLDPLMVAKDAVELTARVNEILSDGLIDNIHICSSEDGPMPACLLLAVGEQAVALVKSIKPQADLAIDMEDGKVKRVQVKNQDDPTVN